MVTINKLLELAKVASDEKPKETLDEVHRFVLALGIKDGKHVVSCKIIYQAFSMWKLARSQKCGSLSFFRRFAKFFPTQRSVDRYYLLNLRPLELLNRVDNMTIKD